MRRGSMRSRMRRSEVTAKRLPNFDQKLWRKASRSASRMKFAVPSAVFSATLPVKPSVTITSTVPLAMSSPSTKPWKRPGSSSARSSSRASHSASWPLRSSAPTLSSPQLGSSVPSTVREKTLPMTAKSTRLCASHCTLAPRSSITVSPRRVGKNEAMAGRSMPGKVFSTILAMAMRAPVLPAETTPSARPSSTASMARRILELRPLRSATDGRSPSLTTSSQWTTVATGLSRFMRSSSGRISPSRPNSRKSTCGKRLRARLAPRSTMRGAWSPPMVSRAIVNRALTDPLRVPALGSPGLPPTARP